MYTRTIKAAILALIGAAGTARAQMTGDSTHAMPGTLGISMHRMGSGTTWIPDAVTLPSRSTMRGPWMLMAHGFATAHFDAQGGPRGDQQFGSLNWAMLMADRPLGGGRLQLRFMPSVDAAIVGKCGYPMLLQSGESCNGGHIVDRQHPHDFFMELGALYERALTPRLAMLLYAAPAGEPALGPVAFMHRPSSLDDPNAPLGHHWQDATHIAFGVVTVGVFTRQLRLEASAFNGREPDEHRWDLEPIRFDSYAARITLNPGEHWSLSTGYGYIHSPERLHPGESIHRMTASAMHGRRLGDAGQWATTLVLGGNHTNENGWSGSVLLESEAVLDDRNAVFARAERVDKTLGELDVAGAPMEPVDVRALSLGYVREVWRMSPLGLGLGARGTVNFVPDVLRSSYGSRTPLGAMIFLRVRPSLRTRGMEMAPSHHHDHMPQ